MIYASRDLQKGEECTYDYKFPLGGRQNSVHVWRCQLPQIPELTVRMLFKYYKYNLSCHYCSSRCHTHRKAFCNGCWISERLSSCNILKSTSGGCVAICRLQPTLSRISGAFVISMNICRNDLVD